MKRNRIVIAVLLAVLVASAVGCKGSGVPKDAVRLQYSTGINADGKYDESLFYRNDLAFTDAPDPGAFYDDGYYYAVVTGVPLHCYRTADFAQWEFMGGMLTPSSDAWSYGNYWAPEIIKNPADGKYYLYYSASGKALPQGAPDATMFERMHIGVAVSDTAYGPYTECRDEKGNTIYFDFVKSPQVQTMLADKSAKIFATIDAHPYFDGDDMYLYFVRQDDRNGGGNAIWGCRMTSPTEPDYNSLKQLTQPRRATVGGAVLDVENSNTINEAPWMIKHTSETPNGPVTKFYLTYSIFGYTDRMYSVCTAVGDSPLGDFTKLDSKHGNPMHGIAPDFDHMSGTGHASIVEGGGETFILYHAHTDREHGGGTRALAADRIVWVYNDDLGYDILHSNGPTYSLQPIPATASGYADVAKGATVTATDILAGAASLLNDGIVAVQTYDDDKELTVSGKGTTITIELPEEKDVRAIMVYNSREIWLAFSKIDSIVFEGSNGKYGIADLLFPQEYYWDDLSRMRPGGAAVATFVEIKVKKVTLTISAKLVPDNGNEDFSGIALSEIVLLGK
ncbi:MAG: family 43 glycosylhydrolase [Clostridia bacterium]|nr:family 43 glycosylhydrolase [Clostridia bacterium]